MTNVAVRLTTRCCDGLHRRGSSGSPGRAEQQSPAHHLWEARTLHASPYVTRHGNASLTQVAREAGSQQYL